MPLSGMEISWMRESASESQGEDKNVGEGKRWREKRREAKQEGERMKGRPTSTYTVHPTPIALADTGQRERESAKVSTWLLAYTAGGMAFCRTHSMTK